MQGDRNTSFYHVSTLVKRKRNQITVIKNNAGDWINEENEVKEHIRKGFSEIYMTTFVSASRAILTSFQWQHRLSNKERDSISRVATEEEVKSALWSLKAFKASRSDGLYAGILPKILVDSGQVHDRKSAKGFAERKIPEYLNKTHITLIPKIQGPEKLINYRPISLCNMVNKVVTKIVVARLRPFLGQLILPL